MTSHPMKSKLISLTLTTCAFIFLYASIQNEDYHTLVDNPKKPVYNCNYILGLSMGGWHPDIPKIEIDRCIYLREKEKQDHARTNQI